jgi:hypothetical protein
MYLENALSRYFHPLTRDRGQELYHKRRVRILRGDRYFVEAEVQGSQVYEVEIQRDGDLLYPYCECPAFEDFGLCKHLWATLLEADRRDFLAGIFGSAKPKFAEREAATTGWDAADAEQAKSAAWRELFRPPPVSPSYYRAEIWPAEREIHYAISLDISRTNGHLMLDVLQRDRKKNGDWAKAKPLRMTRGTIPTLHSADDREVLSLLAGVPSINSYVYYSPGQALAPGYSLRDGLAAILLPRMCATGRCWVRPHGGVDIVEAAPLEWDAGPPWNFRLAVSSSTTDYLVTALLERGDERMDIKEPAVIFEDGLLIAGNKAAPCDFAGQFRWLKLLRQRESVAVPKKDGFAFAQEILAIRGGPGIDWPEELRFEREEIAPEPVLKVSRPRQRRDEVMLAQVRYRYGNVEYDAENPAGGYFDPDGKRYLQRAFDREEERLRQLREAGVKRSPDYMADSDSPWEFPLARLPHVLHRLSESGWHVNIDGQALRRSVGYETELASEIDWFELRGSVDYGGGVKASLPALLKALQRGTNLVKLDDGSFGFVPQDFIDRYGSLLQLGQAQGENLRYTRGQAGLLDAFLAQRPEVRTDELFAEARRQLREFSSIAPAPQPEGFQGRLREYQREGVGWMQFLQKLRFGGCLADDMGVGKTPQVLALLETRRAAGSPPSLAVVPRTLIYNWRQEAERFTPQLKVLDYSGTNRVRDTATFEGYNLILTTYGTLLRDIAFLKDYRFDYAILDEAQAIKNAGSESAKATRLLTADHRLVMTGTPIENHLGDLWSLFEFLNPGMMGASSVLQSANSSWRNPSQETRAVLSQALRPFILRRTKQQVVSELPEKTEQTLYCELDTEQRKLYNELRDHYRNSLLNRIAAEGMAKSRIFILEALLRLRQAACHPGLIDSKRITQSSAKLEALLPQLTEVMEEGHKALVFSQFTSLLAIVQRQLTESGIDYEYLDGKTRDRQSRVERFQNDPDCRLFLVSLKAGGVGLNLTAAEYVFLLDPWWNPAVESQAIDRAHRIGQTQRVFAYRLIARDTVEEKVLQLQNTKRELAAAIIGEDKRLIAKLQREDLELLLS